MTVLDQVLRTRILCDSCRSAWTFTSGDIGVGLRDAGWAVNGAEHECPRCVRRKHA
jgi:hypothetical protein